jgi:hypothetical protein
MYISMFDTIGIMISLTTSITLVLITANANRTLQRENRNLRGRIRRQQEQCRQYHSPRPF